jgi:hypothetical protein
MSNQILKPGKSYSFSEYFDLPFTIDDILAELGCGIKRQADAREINCREAA